MEWGFLDIFKKADFNVLMVAVAITGWVLHFAVDKSNIYFFTAAFLCSIYCGIKLIVYIYNWLSGNYKHNKQLDKIELQQKQQHEQENKKQNAEAMRIYLGLSADSKASLKEILVKGKQAPSTPYYRLISKDDHILVMKAQQVACVFDSPILFMGPRRVWFGLREQPDSLLAVFDPYLYDIFLNEIKMSRI